jgi:chromosome segregation ATPase
MAIGHTAQPPVTRLADMRMVRLLWLVVSILTVGLLSAPMAGAEPPMRLSDYLTDTAGALNPAQRVQVNQAAQQLYGARHIRLWVVYVDTFSGSTGPQWAENTWRQSNLDNYDAILAVAVTDRSYALLVPKAAAGGIDVDALRRNAVEPKLHDGDWAGAAVAAADGLRSPVSSGNHVSWAALIAVLAVIGAAVAALIWWSRRRQRRRRDAELAEAQRLDVTDPDALAALPLDTLEDLSKSVLVEVDNAVRTSDNELALAVGEFGEGDTAPFTAAVRSAKAAMAQAFTVRQTLDDAIPETPQQRRDLLAQVVVSAGGADKELENQRAAFHAMRDLVINAPSRLDALTQQMIALTARVEPSQQTLAGLHGQFAEPALASVAGNVDTAKERLGFAEQNIATARDSVSKPADSQAALVNAIRAAESALGQAGQLLDAIDSAAADINHAVTALPAVIADTQDGINAADALPNGPRSAELTKARAVAMQAVSSAQASGTADPLGAFTQLTAADAALDQLRATIAEETAAAERLRQSYNHALMAAQSRVNGVSDFIDARRGSIGPEARTRLAQAQRHLEAAQDAQGTDLAGAIGHANAAADLAARAQSQANDDVQDAQRAYARTQYGSSTGAQLGGIIIGSMMSGAMRGGGGYGGGWSSTSFGGSGGSGGGFSGGGGRF